MKVCVDIFSQKYRNSFPFKTLLPVNSGFFYANVGDRMKMADGERAFIDQRVRKVIELKNKMYVFSLSLSISVS